MVGALVGGKEVFGGLVGGGYMALDVWRRAGLVC